MVKKALSLCFVLLTSFTLMTFADTPQDLTLPSPSMTGMHEFPNEPQLPPEFLDQYALPSAPPAEDRLYEEFFKMISMLGLIIVLLLLGSWFLKRLLSSRNEQINSTSLIKIIERRSVSAKSAIYVIDILGKKVALAESHNGVTYLGDIPSQVAASGFQQVMNKEL